jgi:hypothetical protein
MTIHRHLLPAALLLVGLSAAAQNPTDDNHVLHPGLIASDTGGAPGYQHGLKQSHFALGTQTRTVTETGWSRQEGSAGAFSVSLHNGVAIALPNAHASAGRKPTYTGDPENHDKQVLQHFLAAGIPRNQVGGVHTMTRLSSGGQRGDTRPTPLKIDGYVSVLERKVEGYPVPDSVAWAQMDNAGKVISEGVYWPAIPAKTLSDARRIRDRLAGSGRDAFLAHVPTGQSPGTIAIRHSSAADQQSAFEVLASYDVLEERGPPALPGALALNSVGPSSSVMRHFDADGIERRLPQERRNAEKEFPPKPKTPPASGSYPPSPR